MHTCTHTHSNSLCPSGRQQLVLIEIKKSHTGRFSSVYSGAMLGRERLSPQPSDISNQCGRDIPPVEMMKVVTVYGVY